MFLAITNGFLRFGRFLTNDVARTNVTLILYAISGLDDYAFNKLFAVWYGKNAQNPNTLNNVWDRWNQDSDQNPAAVKKLFHDIPGMIPLHVPDEFMFYPHRRYEGTNWQEQRTNMWRIVWKHVDVRFK